MQFQAKYQGPWIDASRNNLLTNKVGEWGYQKPVTIIEKCCHCGTCYLLCPTGCIGDKGTYFAADLEYCKGCSLCMKVCPVSAIGMVIEGRE
jgi:pyruvate ferredoxin oxidoreductase delta subunit